MTKQNNYEEILGEMLQAGDRRGAKDKILVVDDVEENRFILKEILNGYEVDEAVNGKEALEKITGRGADYSLVLLDIMMPEMDGYGVLEELSKRGLAGKPPVIVITAAGGGENEVKGLELGAVDYIAKPFYPKSVVVRVENQLELNKYRRHLEKMLKK